MLWAGVILHVYFICYCDAFLAKNSRHKPQTEAEYLERNNDDRVHTVKQTVDRINDLRTRRKQASWDLHNEEVLRALEKYGDVSTRPNILVMMADDLGYGDLSVPPFTTPPQKGWPCAEGGILTPNLERMARKGTIMTNFHAAAPVCSPARTAMMTGLYPWRNGALNAFEVGRDISQKNGFLPQVPTLPELLRESGYYTAHSGKWHMGGMREENRKNRVAQQHNCYPPGPHQHGFEEFSTELDGPESPRYTFLLSQKILHSQGHRFQIQDDIPLPNSDQYPYPSLYNHTHVSAAAAVPQHAGSASSEVSIEQNRDMKHKNLRSTSHNRHNQPTQMRTPGPPHTSGDHYLSDREARDAIHYMEKRTLRNPAQPWFIQVWFNAPHGPWERLPKGEEVYTQHPLNHTLTASAAKNRQKDRIWDDVVCPADVDHKQPAYRLTEGKRWHYKTMVSAMDVSIGRLLDALEDLGIENNTLVLFTSDNGPENDAGTAHSCPASEARCRWASVDHTMAEESSTMDYDVKYMGRKRSLMEGGLRVPAIWQWPGKIPAAGLLDVFAGHTDVLPTMLDAAGLAGHSLLREGVNLASTVDSLGRSGAEAAAFDGLSLLPSLLYPTEVHLQSARRHVSASGSASSESEERRTSTLSPIAKQKGLLRDRVYLWHKDTDPAYPIEPRVQSAGYYDHVKIITYGKSGYLHSIYDLKHDPFEQHNLIRDPENSDVFYSGSMLPPVVSKAVVGSARWMELNGLFEAGDWRFALNASLWRMLSDSEAYVGHCAGVVNGTNGPTAFPAHHPKASESENVPADAFGRCIHFYRIPLIKKIIIIWGQLVSFSMHGGDAHQQYLTFQGQLTATCAIPSSYGDVSHYDYTCTVPPTVSSPTSRSWTRPQYIL